MPSLTETTRADAIPLAVDLDGTLIRTDMIWESLARLWRRRPLTAIYSLLALVRGRAYFKQQLAARVTVDPAELPYHADFLAWLKEQKAAGRKLILATASDRKMAEPVAAYIGIFDEVMASDGTTNLRGANKRRALSAKFGERGYDYAGNSSVDLGVWPGTRAAIVVNARPGLAERAARLTEVSRVFG